MDRIMAYPFSGSGVAGVFDPKSSLEGYESALRNILMTEKGSVPWNPEFGSELHKFVFDLNDLISQNLIMFYAFEDIQAQEPRLRIVDTYASFDVDRYSASFTVAFVAYDDPSQTLRTAKIAEVPMRQA